MVLTWKEHFQAQDCPWPISSKGQFVVFLAFDIWEQTLKAFGASYYTVEGTRTHSILYHTLLYCTKLHYMYTIQCTWPRCEVPEGFVQTLECRPLPAISHLLTLETSFEVDFEFSDPLLLQKLSRALTLPASFAVASVSSTAWFSSPSHLVLPDSAPAALHMGSPHLLSPAAPPSPSKWNRLKNLSSLYSSYNNPEKN